MTTFERVLPMNQLGSTSQAETEMALRRDLAGAYRTALGERSLPAVIDVVVTRDPGAMLPAADNRTLVVKAGDRPV